MMVSCDNGNETSDSIKGKILLTSWASTGSFDFYPRT